MARLLSAVLVFAAVLGVCFSAQLRQSCASDTCTVENSECRDSVCVCKQDYFPSFDGLKCHASANVYNATCSSREECAETLGDKALCTVRGQNVTASTCLCMVGNHYYNYTCVESKGLKDSCGTNIPGRCYLALDGSSQHIVCASNGTCVCEEGYSPDSRFLSCSNFETCSADADCSSYQNARCSSGLCKCQRGFDAFNYEDRTYCAKGLRSSCQATTDCIVNSECSDGVCSCAVDYFPSFDGNKCHAKAEVYGAQCEVQEECAESLGTHSTCDATNGCVCTSQAHYADYGCHVTLAWGARCGTDVDGQCYLAADGEDQHVTCAANNTCACQNGYTPSPGMDRCGSSPSSLLAISCILFGIIVNTLV